MKPIYLDHNATTPIRSEVLAAMQPFLTETFGNASSIHSFGREARYGLEVAREKVANFIGADPEEIIFTSCGTESNNHAIGGVVKSLKEKGNHIITSNIEHSCVRNVCKALEQDGCEVTWIEANESGLVSASDVEAAIKDNTILITVMHANNEVGTIQPVKEIGRIAREHGILFHCDTVQSVGKIPVDVNDLNVDFCSISGHKNYAPKGTGVLYIKKGISIPSFILGGTHERKRRAGTENVAGCVGLGAALELAQQDLEKKNKELASIRDELEAKILQSIPDSAVAGAKDSRIPNTLSLGFKGVEGDSLARNLDLEGIAVSTGSACASGAVQLSHVLEAMKIPFDYAKGSIRISLGHLNTKEQIPHIVNTLKTCVNRIRSVKR